jgi:CheY-like chemotaxis protein
MSRKAPFNILVAEDDPDDRLLLKEALFESGLDAVLQFVEDGEALMAYLDRCSSQPSGRLPRPSLVVVDLNMPKKDGREALAEIKARGIHRKIPVVILTTSNAEEDISYCYDNGAHAYITKPTSFKQWVEIVGALERYGGSPDMTRLGPKTPWADPECLPVRNRSPSPENSR